MSDDAQEEKSKSVKWKCKTCSNIVVVHVRLSEPPMCNNKKHLTKSVLMERV